eukprot:CAMPEP_0171186568 /NCGR_PEP_ID=MMETSP0790-20130122/16879_1 /TAXON_ID=2925 /ORGANISM="Alexandrium catenella, Strain OF101" /LENGTH=173 /DNA_ID=CAMNT_0011651615 /DNA_START=66 /DNA_END=587 /DNA_ORIENTATION=+
MPLFGLFMKAELENVARITFPQETDWTLDIQEPSGVDIRERITVNANEEEEIPNSKGKANFLVKFEGAKQVSTMSMLTLTRKTELKDFKGVSELGVFTAEGGGKVPIAVFDCRGVEPIKWYPVGPFTVETEGGKTFAGVDLTDAIGDGWCEYDEGAEAPVNITDLTFEFKTVR